MAQRRNGCGCLLGLVIVGAIVGGPTIFGKTEDAARTVPVTSGPSSSAPPTGERTTSIEKRAPKTSAVKVPAPKASRAPKTTAPAKSPRSTAPPPPVPQAEVPDAPSPSYYANCSAARAAGAAPLYRGQPGYRSALDRDNDGVACET